MPELNNEFQLPQERTQATPLEHGDELDFHTASESAVPLEQVRLAREAFTLASTTPFEQTISTVQPEVDILPPSQLKLVGGNLRAFRKYEEDSRIDLFTDEAA